MNHQKTKLHFLFILLVLIVVLSFYIFRPFIYTLIMAIVFATIFGSTHKKLLVITRESKGLSALLATAFVLVIVVAPISFLGIQIFQETAQLYYSLVENGGSSGLSRDVNVVIQSLTKFYPAPIEFSVDVESYLKQGLSWLLQHLDTIFANTAKAMLNLFIFLVALYYLFKDGHKLKKTVIDLSPLQDVHDEIIFSKLTLAVNSIIKGSLVVAIVQGVLTAVGFTIFGIPNATLWGSVAAIAALIPSIGTALVIVPAILFLVFIGNTVFAGGLLVWGIVAVGLVDNFLGPKLVERGVQIHPFLILLSIMGGISFFGPMGFLLGPLVLSLLFVFLEIYFTISKQGIE